MLQLMVNFRGVRVDFQSLRDCEGKVVMDGLDKAALRRRGIWYTRAAADVEAEVFRRAEQVWGAFLRSGAIQAVFFVRTCGGEGAVEWGGEGAPPQLPPASSCSSAC
jgi:hypothetical protein